MDEKMNKKAQLMIWVIVAIAIVVVIILFFFLQQQIRPKVSERVEEDPRLFIEACVKNYVNEAVDLMLPKGGFVKSKHSIQYQNINVSYLCYNSGNYNPCINEHPLLLNEIKNEIKEYVEPRIEQCFSDYKLEIEKRGARVEFSAMKLEVGLAPEKIYLEISRDINLIKKEQNYNFNEFDFEIINPVYDLSRIAMEIASQESKYCYFEYVGYMILYPRFKINRLPLSDSTEIYRIEDKNTGKVMNIAIRSCAIPPGL